MPTHCLKKLYFAFIYPHLLYGIEVYANTSKSNLTRLSNLNNKLIRIVLNEKLNVPSAQLYKKLNVLPISELHQMQLVIFVNKCLFHKDLLPVIFREYFASMNTVHNHNTRSNAHLTLFRSNKSIGQRCTNYKCCKLWNLLPENLKVKTSVTVFKKNVLLYMFNCLS